MVAVGGAGSDPGGERIDGGQRRLRGDVGHDVGDEPGLTERLHHPRHDAGELAVALRERAIIVRHFRLPRIDQHLRITIGTREECEALVAALRELLV